MSISGQTRLLGLLGWPVSHSLSPAMHNAAAAALQLDVVYLPLPVMPEHVEEALRGLVALGFLGANVTVPHKQAVMPHLGSIEPAAEAIGAVNTIKVASANDRRRQTADRRRQTADRRRQTADRRNPQSPISSLQSPVPNLHGFNTDWSGFLADLRANGVAISGRDCVILGAGGSARAVAYALAREGGRVSVFARRPAQAGDLVDDLGTHLPDASLSAAAWRQLSRIQDYKTPLIVNTTPVGMHPNGDASPWPRAFPLPQNADVYDVIYNPAETQLMRQARAADCRAFNGLGMLLQQGAQAFEHWLGVKPPLEVMAAALRREGFA